MRDLAITSFLIIGALAALGRPWRGVILWAIVSLMNPHRLTWGFAYDWPWAQWIVATTMIGLLFHWKEAQAKWYAPVILLVVFTVWQSITYPFSFNPELSYEMWTRVLKINFMLLVTIALLHTRKHVHALVWVIVISLGLYGVKGGLFTLATGGHYRVYGPTQTFIEGNNEVALALTMVIPLMYYLSSVATKKYVKWGLRVSMLLCVVSVLGSHSRGALVAIAAMSVLLVWKSEKKLGVGALVVLGAALILPLMPEQWWERMETIQDYDTDASAQGRINSWWLTVNVAKAHFFGGGYAMYTRDVFAQFAPNPLDIHVAHSIYFSTLGEHGVVGLVLFLAFWAATWRAAGWAQRDARVRTGPEFAWARMLFAMVKVSLIGYLVGGAFLSLAYFDLPYYLMAIVVVTRYSIEKARQQEPVLQHATPPSVAAQPH
ncbi:MAG TPA: putative O-glycosylation ligase, exosortase A system-associated [Burkholderiales bacterium]|nr:putative O-glycosylation ligase, exosortase A system-associated [Burkholderiales bacterium]